MKLTLLLVISCLATSRTRLSSAEKLSPDSRAPLFAHGAGGLELEAPSEGPVKTYASILKETNRPNFGDGEYAFNFETEDGVQREEVGKLKMVNGQLVTVVQGRYSYTSPEGLAIDVKYTADENGARSSFTFGTDPGRWRQSLSLPGLHGVKGKLTAGTPSETGREYLPPSKNEKISNDYLPASKNEKISNDYLPSFRNEKIKNDYPPPSKKEKISDDYLRPPKIEKISNDYLPPAKR